MQTNYPVKTTVEVNASGSGVIQVYHNPPPHEAPLNVAEWLSRMGWEYSIQCPDTGEKLFTPPSSEPVFGYYKWYEAVAYINYQFLSLQAGAMV